MNKLNVEKPVKGSLTANPNMRKILILAGLVLASFMSTSYASSDDSGPNCAANYKELEKHPEAGGKCSPDGLKSRLAGLTGRKWNGPMGYTVMFKNIKENENFYLVLNNAKKFGNICCTKGVWKIGGYKVGVPKGNALQIGDYEFSSEEQSMLRTPVQFAELQNNSQGGVN